MLYPIVCFTCNGPLGEFELVFLRLRREKLAAARKEYDVAPGRELCVPGYSVELGTELDELGVKNECCRSRMLTAVVK
jgi:DNA-directed RNA polymerase subunit N (RpoN/RPB10)